VTLLIGVALLTASAIASFYAGFCLLGGPDGAILSRSSFAFGIPALLLAVALTYGATRVNAGAPWLYAIPLAPVVAWLAAVVLSQRAGFNLWLFGTPVVFVATVGYWLVALATRAGQSG
jgi:hypothetical protein